MNLLRSARPGLWRKVSPVDRELESEWSKLARARLEFSLILCGYREVSGLGGNLLHCLIFVQNSQLLGRILATHIGVPVRSNLTNAQYVTY